MALFDNLFSDIKNTLTTILGADIFTNPFGSQVSYRYPLGDTARYENVIKFTALEIGRAHV